MIAGRLYPFHQHVRWLFIILLLVVISGLGYQPLRSVVEQYRLFHRVEQLTLNSLQIEGHDSSYDPWQDLAPLTTAEGRAVAQQALTEAQRLAATAPYDTEALRQLGVQHYWPVSQILRLLLFRRQLPNVLTVP